MLTLALTLPLLLASPPGQHPRLMDAIRWVESAGNDHAVGDQGQARGPLQAHRACWLDAQAQLRREGHPWAGRGYDRWCWDYATSCAIAAAYWRRYGARTDCEKAMCWNAGPRWRTRGVAASENYWQRVLKELKKENTNGRKS